MHTNRCKIVAAIAAGTLGLLVAACSSRSVQGHTYQDSTGNFKLEFSTGGKAYFRLGAMTQPCGYSESGRTVVLTCPDEKFNLTVGDDGALSGPPDGLLARLTKSR